MTENEAIELHIGENLHRIEVIEEFLRTNFDADDKEGKKNIQILTKTNGALKEIQQYRSIGTLSECREAVEKQRAKKPIARNDDRKIYMCQCGNTQINTMDNYCSICGQAIDWGSEAQADPPQDAPWKEHIAQRFGRVE